MAYLLYPQLFVHVYLLSSLFNMCAVIRRWGMVWRQCVFYVLSMFMDYDDQMSMPVPNSSSKQHFVVDDFTLFLFLRESVAIVLRKKHVFRDKWFTNFENAPFLPTCLCFV